MGRIFTTSFDNEADRFYVCGACRTHIARLEALRHTRPALDAVTTAGIFDNADTNNLAVQDSQLLHVVDYSIMDVNCVNCCNKLGFKYVQLPNNEPTIQQGWINLEFTKLRKWNGREFVNAETVRLNENNPNAALYICNRCNTHIALNQELVLYHQFPVEDLNGRVFGNCVNLDVADDPARLRHFDGFTLADAFCSACNTHLGSRIVEVPEEEVLLGEGWVQLLTSRVRLLNQ